VALKDVYPKRQIPVYATEHTGYNMGWGYYSPDYTWTGYTLARYIVIHRRSIADSQQPRA